MLAMVATATVCLQMNDRAIAADTDWSAFNGGWSNGANWAPKIVPVTGDDVFINGGDNVARTITYDYDGSAVSLAQLEVDLTGPSSSSNYDTLSMAANDLTSGTEYIGDFGNGAINQSGGTNTVSSGLYLGFNSASSGQYTLSGTGSLSATGNEYIGYHGTGAFNQSGGTNTTGNDLYLGFETGISGVYTLGGTGSLSVAEIEYVGDGRPGTFSQSGGTNTTSQLIVGNGGGPGTYSLGGSGSLLSTAAEIIGGGIINQTGGMNNTPELDVGYFGSGAAYTLGGGSLSVTGTEYVALAGGGTFNQTSGMNTAGGLNLGYNFSESGHSSSGTYTLSDGSLSITGTAYVGYVPSDSTNGSTGTFTQSGGSVSFSGSDSNNNSLSIGDQAGSQGVYSLISGSVNVPSDESVGNGGSGTFVQSGGTNTVGSNIVIGHESGGSGTYTLNGVGSVVSVTGNVLVGGNSSAVGGFNFLNIEGGQATIDRTLKVWSGGGVEVSITGGNISVGNTVNLALIDQTGGTSSLGAVSGTGNIIVGSPFGASASASMTVSALTQNSVNVESTGILTMVGGASNNTLNQLTINGSGII
jgi:hypothetical protein